MTITVSTDVAAPLEAVWRAYTTPADIMVWNSASPDWHTPSASVDLREGGRFCSRMEARDGSMGFDFEGVYTRIVPLQRLEYRFGDRQAQVEFWPGPQAVTVRVSFDPETVFPEDQQRAGWQAILDHFKRHVEGQAPA
ncbi:MAG: hypothetical protein RIQ38_982 [Pseudomonadota bacterium]|jgi:uncharacterized protein YndB with AHSA1/START domain